MAIRKPWWSPANINLIFADQRVTDGLLNRLDIKNACVLRGDYYHLANEVWLRDEIFGQVVMARIAPWFRKMLVSLHEN